MTKLGFKALLLTIIATCLFIILYINERQSRIATQAEVAKLTLELERFKVAAAKPARPHSETVLALSNPLTSDRNTQKSQDLNVPPKAPSDQEEKRPARLRFQEMPQGVRKWLVKRKVGDIEQFIALSDEQKEALALKFESDFTARQESEDSSDFIGNDEDPQKELELLSQVLAPELAAEYQKRKLERQAHMEQERLDQELFSYSRKLSLSREQESSVRSALAEVNTEMKSVQKDAWKKMRETFRDAHENSDGEDSASSFEDFSKLTKEIQEQKKQLMNSRLRPMLTDEQYNALLADQENTPDRGFVYWGH